MNNQPAISKPDDAKIAEQRPCYAISLWNEHYEKNHKGDRERVFRWVAVPTKHDGKGFKRIARHPEGVAIFCAWNLILQVAAKCPERGVLADEDGPLDATDLADETSFPVHIFEIALKVLSEPKIGWILVQKSGQVRTSPGQVPPTVQDSTVHNPLNPPGEIFHEPIAARHNRPAEHSHDVADTPTGPDSPESHDVAAPTGPDSPESHDVAAPTGPEVHESHDAPFAQQAPDDGSVRAAWEALSKWSQVATRFPLAMAHNQERHVRKLLDALASEPPIIHGGKLIPQRLLIPMAAEFFIKTRGEFKSIAYACKCIEGKLDSWAKEAPPNAPATPVDRIAIDKARNAAETRMDAAAIIEADRAIAKAAMGNGRGVAHA